MFMPGEFEPHERCWMAWPCRSAAFGGRLTEARRSFSNVAKSVAAFEPVIMLARPQDSVEAASLCGPLVAIRTLPLDDSWTRDTGPVFIINTFGDVAGVDFKFNGWGGVWPEYQNDAQLAGSIMELAGLPCYSAGIVIEGGAIHVDGQGTLMAVAPCLLDSNRNPGLMRSDLECILSANLGVTHFIWLEHGLENDETSGHIDNVACFARPGVVLANDTSDSMDGNYFGAKENIARLRAEHDAHGNPLTVIPLEQPEFRPGKNGRLALSYVNFYLANGGLIMPSFDDPHDRNARDILAQVFPKRRVVQIAAADIVYGGGGIHCITLQQPLARRHSASQTAKG
ncbi:MAG: agmatine deiminase family protein [Deltaproteobacteria bacterium]|nr:agmatine deiminase family protein [Deltaproteobacteria bacterium]